MQPADEWHVTVPNSEPQGSLLSVFQKTPKIPSWHAMPWNALQAQRQLRPPAPVACALHTHAVVWPIPVGYCILPLTTVAASPFLDKGQVPGHTLAINPANTDVEESEAVTVLPFSLAPTSECN